jgi:hypothetical protein
VSRSCKAALLLLQAIEIRVFTRFPVNAFPRGLAVFPRLPAANQDFRVGDDGIVQRQAVLVEAGINARTGGAT